MHRFIRPLSNLSGMQDPLLIAGFAGASGTAAAGAIGYLVEQWDAEPIAEFDPDELYVFTGLRPMVLQRDGERSLEWPGITVHRARPAGIDRDVVLVAGVEPHLRWAAFADAIASLMHEVGAKDAVLLGAYPAATPHTRELPTMVSGSDDAFARRAGVEPTVSNYQGPVDVRGVLDVHLAKGFRTANVTVMVPFYVANEQSPRAIIELVEAVDGILGTATPLATIKRQAARMDQHADEMAQGSEDLGELVHSLEARFDAAIGTPRQLSAGESLDDSNVDLIADVEEFLRSEPGTSNQGWDGGAFPS